MFRAIVLFLLKLLVVSTLAATQHHRRLQELLPNCTNQLNEFRLQVAGEDYFDPTSVWGTYYLSQLAVELKIHQANNNMTMIESETFGRNGQYTDVLVTQHEDLIRFWGLTSIWGLSSTTVLLAGAHGEDLQEIDSLPTALNATYRANNIQNKTDEQLFNDTMTVFSYIITSLPDGFHNPALTTRAQATRLRQSVHSSIIVIGDGLMEAFELFIGLDDVLAARFIHAHEFAHVVMQWLGTTSSSSIESIRREDLEADAMAAYYLASSSLSISQLHTITDIAFASGSCQNDTVRRQGTPQTRKCATIWGANQAASNMNMTAREFRPAFNAVYDGIVNVDPSICGELVEGGGPESTSSGPNLRLRVSCIAGILLLLYIF